MTKIEKQINLIYNDLTELQNKEFFDPKIIQSQIFLETSYLNNILKDSNNIFNIKWKGNEKEISEKLNINITKKKYHVWEILNDKKVWVDEYFRCYDTIYDSLIDYLDYIKNKTNENIFINYGKNPVEYYKILKNFGYQTDPFYVNKLIKMYNLTSYVWYDRMELIKIIQKLTNSTVDGFLGNETKNNLKNNNIIL